LSFGVVAGPAGFSDVEVPLPLLSALDSDAVSDLVSVLVSSALDSAEVFVPVVEPLSLFRA
jgi:hypothetical protein